MEEEATTVCGARHRRHGDRRGFRWGKTQSEIGYHGGKVKVARPRVCGRAGKCSATARCARSSWCWLTEPHAWAKIIFIDEDYAGIFQRSLKPLHC